MSQATLRVQKISGHAGSVPGEDAQREFTVCKLIDTTTCIGCKACEVACMEWNDLPFGETVFDNTYQTMPETRWNYWNLILFNEHEKEDGSLMWLMRKNQCMHCADPGCLAACPADGAIVQYTNGIVDFQQANCIGCGYCITGCPFDIPKMNPKTNRVFKCTLCADRVSESLEPACIKSCPTGCLHFGSKEDMLDTAEKRAKQLRTDYNFPNAGVYDPAGVGGTGVVYVLHDATKPELYGGLAVQSEHSVVCEAVEGSAEVAGKCGDDRRDRRTCRALLAVWAKRARRDDQGTASRSGAVSETEQVVPPGHVLRYNFKERITHWIAAGSYLYLLLSGLAFWSPWLFPWLVAICGGGQVSRMLHPWMGLIFAACVVVMYAMWAAHMNVDENDKVWFKSVGYYVQNEDEKMPPAGRYNAGQKSLFWGFVVCMALLLLSGIVLWYHGIYSVEFALFALHRGIGTRIVGSADHRAFSASHLHGSFRGARRIGFHGSRRCPPELRETVSSELV